MQGVVVDAPHIAILIIAIGDVLARSIGLLDQVSGQIIVIGIPAAAKILTPGQVSERIGIFVAGYACMEKGANPIRQTSAMKNGRCWRPI